MKNKIYTTLIGLFILLTFTTSTLAQNLPVLRKKGLIHDIKYSPDGTRLAVAGMYGIWLYDAQTGKELQSITEDMIGALGSLAFSPDGKVLASGRYDKTVHLWNMDTGELLRTLKGHKGAVSSLAFSPDGRVLASGSWDKTVRLWDMDTGDLLRTLKGHKDKVWSVAFSPDGQAIAVGHWGGVHLWDMNTGERIRVLNQHRIIKANTASVSSVAFSPDGKTIATGSTNAIIRLWDVDTGKPLRVINGRQLREMRPLLTVASDNNRTNVVNGALISSVTFSPDGSMLASTNMGATTLWDVNTKKELRRLYNTNKSGGVIAPTA